MSFKVGDRVVCIKSFDYKYFDFVKRAWIKDESIWCPIKNHDYHVTHICPDGYIMIKECPDYASFDNKKFRKLDYDFAKEVIKQVKPEKMTV